MLDGAEPGQVAKTKLEIADIFQKHGRHGGGPMRDMSLCPSSK
jgi:hypothetical protein